MVGEADLEVKQDDKCAAMSSSPPGFLVQSYNKKAAHPVLELYLYYPKNQFRFCGLDLRESATYRVLSVNPTSIPPFQTTKQSSPPNHATKHEGPA